MSEQQPGHGNLIVEPIRLRDGRILSAFDMGEKVEFLAGDLRFRYDDDELALLGQGSLLSGVIRISRACYSDPAVLPDMLEHSYKPFANSELLPLWLQRIDEWESMHCEAGFPGLDEWHQFFDVYCEH